MATIYDVQRAEKLFLPSPMTALNTASYVAADPINNTDPTGQCRERDGDGECVVRNRAGAEGVAPARELQTRLRELDRRIKLLERNQRIVIRNSAGERIGTTTGREVQRIWARSSWAITPSSTNHGNQGGGGGAYSGHNIQFNASSFNYYASLGANRSAAISSLALHEIGHYTRFGRDLTSQYPVLNHGPGTTGFDIRERGATAVGRAVSTEIQEPYECGIFDIGC